MELCSIHGRPNNRYGYCVECEIDPNIVILSCSSCGKPFANNIENLGRECPSCIARFVTRSYGSDEIYSASTTKIKAPKSLDEYSREDFLGLMDILSPLVIIIVGLFVSSKSTPTNILFLYTLFLGPGILAAIAARSIGLFFRYIGFAFVVAFGIWILGSILKWTENTHDIILVISLGFYAFWRALKHESSSKEKYEVIPTKFPYVFSSAVVISLFFLVAGFSGKGEDTGTSKMKNYSIAIVNVRTANLRSGSSINNSIIGKVRRGDTLRIISTSNDWLFIEHKNTKGYIYKKLVTQNAISVSN